MSVASSGVTARKLKHLGKLKNLNEGLKEYLHIAFELHHYPFSSTFLGLVCGAC